MKKRNILTYIAGALPIVFSICTLLAFTYFNFLCYHVGEDKVITSVFVFPVLSLICAVILMIFFFKKKDILCLVLIGVTVALSVSSFIFADSAFSAKTEHDFLKNEKYFNQTAEGLIEDYKKDGGTLRIYPSEELKNILPPLKAEVIPTDSKNPVVFLYALETDEKYEGYAYLPDGIYPIAWDIQYSEWSEPLDINNKWYYICIYK